MPRTELCKRLELKDITKLSLTRSLFKLTNFFSVIDNFAEDELPFFSGIPDIKLTNEGVLW